ncbi:MAG TPA: GNAT family N-acetyltransferase, partial [Methylomirabilota bacterium]|nr:GNAT family N-acetyltransferase [Methylomirabilota bacterium]
MFVAEESAEPVGMAFGTVDRERAGAAHLGGMWTEPARRGRGIGQALAEAVFAWAHERGFDHLVLWVTEGNTPAIALYERLGFAATGRHDRLPAHPALGTFEMERTLCRPPAILQ